MIINGRMAWNMLSKEDHILAEQMIAFKDKSACDHVAEARMQQSQMLSRHCPILIPNGFCPFSCMKIGRWFQINIEKG